MVFDSAGLPKSHGLRYSRIYVSAVVAYTMALAAEFPTVNHIYSLIVILFYGSYKHHGFYKSTFKWATDISYILPMRELCICL